MKLIKKNLLYILAFGIPVLIMILMYILRGIYPFGEECYLRSDMYHQYAPFLKEFFSKITSGESLLYSWNIGMGVNFVPLYSYYLASPLNWFVFIVPPGHIIEVMSIFIIGKIGLMSFTFAYYVSKHFKTKHIVIAVFSMFYALSAYIAAFSWNLMWLDCLLLLPLVVLGLERLVKEGKCFLYCVTLALCIISNYYIAIMICIFCVLYFIFLIVCEKINLKIILNFILYSLIAGGLGAFLLIPTFIGLTMTSSGDISFPQSLVTYFPIYKIISRGLMNVDPAIFTAHDANIYSSVIVFLMIPLYFFNKKTKLKEKIGKTVLLGFFILSFNLNYLDYIWHGFHFPNSLPCRESFIFIFLLLVMSFESFTNIGKLSRKQLFGTLAGAIGLILFFEVTFVSTGEVSTLSVYFSILFIILYIIIFTIFRNTKINRNLIFYIFFIVAILEMIINTNQTALGTTSRTSYLADNQATEILLEKVESNDESFYRIEKVSRRSKNDAAWSDYKGVSIFSSTTNAGLNTLLSSFGFEGSTNAYAFYGHTPLTSALLSVKYMLSNTELEENSYLKKYASQDGTYLYENTYTLPLGFMVDNNLELNFDNENLNPFLVQNSFIKSATGYGDLYTDIPAVSNANMLSFTVSTTEHVFIYVYSDIENVDVQINNFDTGYSDSKYFSSIAHTYILDLGTIEAGSEVDVTCYNKENSVIYSGIQVVYFNEDIFKDAFNVLNSTPLNITEYDDGYIKGTVEAKEDNLLFTSIPFDYGWKAYVDGEETEILSFKDALISIKVPEGTHVIEFKFFPKGLFYGILISGISFIILAFLITYSILRKRRKNQLVKE